MGQAESPIPLLMLAWRTLQPECLGTEKLLALNRGLILSRGLLLAVPQGAQQEPLVPFQQYPLIARFMERLRALDRVQAREAYPLGLQAHLLAPDCQRCQEFRRCQLIRTRRGQLETQSSRIWY